MPNSKLEVQAPSAEFHLSLEIDTYHPEHSQWLYIVPKNKIKASSTVFSSCSIRSLQFNHWHLGASRLQQTSANVPSGNSIGKTTPGSVYWNQRTQITYTRLDPPPPPSCWGYLSYKTLTGSLMPAATPSEQLSKTAWELKFVILLNIKPNGCNKATGVIECRIMFSFGDCRSSVPNTSSPLFFLLS